MASFAAAALSTIASTISGAASAGASALGAGALGVASGATTAAAGVGAAAAGSGILGALGTGATLIGGGLSLAATLLQGGLTVSSAMAARRAAEAEAIGYDIQAADVSTDIQLEQVQGLERRNSLRRALIEAVGEQDVAAAASGVELGFGTPAIARAEASRDTERALTTDRATEKFNTARLEEKAGRYRMLASEARRGGLAKATGIVGSGLIDILNRG